MTFLFIFYFLCIDDYCVWIQKLDEKTLQNFADDFITAKKEWEQGPGRGKMSVELNLEKIEEWAEQQGEMEVEEDDEEEEDEESVEEVGQEEESGEEESEDEDESEEESEEDEVEEVAEGEEN